MRTFTKYAFSTALIKIKNITCLKNIFAWKSNLLTNSLKTCYFLVFKYQVRIKQSAFEHYDTGCPNHTGTIAL